VPLGGIEELTAETAVGSAHVLVASNRGPVTFSAATNGDLLSRRGAGGLVSGLSAISGAVGRNRPLWVCAALSDADRRASRSAPGGRLDQVGHDTGGAAVRMLDVEQVVFDRAYNAVANRTLWFVQHMLYAPAMAPHFGPAFARDWDAYEHYNTMFADALAREAAPGAAALVQDYHLTLVPGLLRARRPDLRISHFSHTPWAPPEYFRMLPDPVGRAVLSGMLGADRLGFLTAAWAEAFCRCAVAILGATLTADDPGADQVLTLDGHRTAVGVHPLGVDGPELLARAGERDVLARVAELNEIIGDRKVIVRVDRTELSKNIVRGLDAYRELLRSHPRWRGRVVHLVCAYPSRHDLPEYREYTAAVQRIAGEIEDEFATDSWLPLRLEMTDDYPRSLAALSLADVLVVNPLRDGMNLVAKEGPVLAQSGAALVLSREAGACAELAPDSIVVNPFDVGETAEAMHAALLMPPDERLNRCRRLAAAATSQPPARWFADQLDALTS
jgi:trehalose 6-phosphate synthase